MKVLIGSLIQESNTFSPVRSTMDDFRRHHLALGEEMFSVRTENELSGFLRAAREHGVAVVPSLSANAISSGVFAREAFEQLGRLLDERLEGAETCDGVYFALHGAMVAEGCDDVEGWIIERIRQRIGPEKPLVVSLDLHANVTRKMVAGASALIGFRTFPHTDFAQTGRRSAELLFAMLKDGLRPRMALRKIPMIVPAENSQTSHGPFADLWAEAEKGERRDDILATSLFPVQPWLDVEELGCAVVVVGTDDAAAREEADRLAGLFWEKRREFQVRLYTVGEIVKLADERRAGDPPFVISDSADSPGAGATGDSNVVLKELLAHGAHRRHRCLLTIVDAPAAARAAEAGVGSEVTLRVGYTLNRNARYGAPMEITGSVRHVGEGVFRIGGGYAENTVAKMGRCAVVDIGKLSLLVTERPTFSGDPAMYRCVGLEPAEADVVLVKSANQFRAEYEQLTDRIFILDTPGISPANLAGLRFDKIRRPFYPFDDNLEWRIDS